MAFIDWDKSPGASSERKLITLSESIMRAFDDVDAGEISNDVIDKICGEGASKSGGFVDMSAVMAHIRNKNNPHNVTKEQLGITGSGSESMDAITNTQLEALLK